jgi:eukaryotic-like serine/threonine-protein kinase
VLVIAEATVTEPSPERQALRELAAGTQIGRYRIATAIGTGGMGVVYRAHDPFLARDVAIKVMHEYQRRLPDAADLHGRLLREAQALARLAHPNVVAAFDVGWHDGAVFLAMELVEGVSLRAWLATPRSRRAVVALLIAAGRGLAAAHAAGVLHRDVKPENVLVGVDGRVRVVDFGLARHASNEEPPAAVEATISSSDDTLAGAIMGTPGFMAPEQVCGGPVDARADQFGFAATCFHALAGMAPFAGHDPTTYRGELVLRRRRALPRGIGRGLRRVILRGLAFDPAARYPTMTALVDALARAAAAPRRIALAAGGIAVLGTAIAITSIAATPSERTCELDPAPFAGIWDPARRAVIERRFAASRAPFAAETFASVATRFDDLTARWREREVAACEAARRGEESERVLALRRACLAHRRDELAAVAAMLERADERQIEHAASAARDLDDLAACADVPTLLGESDALPADLARRADLAVAQHRLATARAGLLLGDHRSALSTATSVLAALPPGAHAPTETRARLLRARALEELGRDGDVAPLFEEALASSAAFPRLRADVTTSYLAFLTNERRMVAAVALVPHVDADITAAGNPPRLRVALGVLRSRIAAFHHELDAATAALAEAGASCASGAVDEATCFAVEQQRAMIDLEAERHAQAAARFGELIARRARLLGASHPVLISDYINQITSLAESGDRAAAFAVLARLRGLVAKLPPSPIHGRIALLEGTIWHETGECLRALPPLRAAVEHPAIDVRSRTIAQLRLGRCLTLSGDGAAAIPVLEAVAAQRRAEDAPVAWRGEVALDLARALWLVPAQRARARAVAREAVELWRRAGPDADAEREAAERWLATRP